MHLGEDDAIAWSSHAHSSSLSKQGWLLHMASETKVQRQNMAYSEGQGSWDKPALCEWGLFLLI